MTKIETKIHEAIIDIYKPNADKDVKKSKYTVINEIHRKIGGGELKNSIIAFICDLFGYKSPKLAKIVKSLRAYKIDSYQDLTKKIQEIRTKNPAMENPINIAKLVHNELPLFSEEEIVHVINHSDDCAKIINAILEKDGVSKKNNAWKQITTKMHQEAKINASKKEDRTLDIERKKTAIETKNGLTTHLASLKAQISDLESLKVKTDNDTFLIKELKKQANEICALHLFQPAIYTTEEVINN